MSKRRPSWNTVELFIRATLLLILTSLAIWDAEQIVRAYVNDNLLTLVKLVPVTDEFPFLEDVVIVFERDDDQTVFLETRGITDSELNALFDLRNSRWYQNDSTDGKGQKRNPRPVVENGAKNVSLQERLQLSVLSELVMNIELQQQTVEQLLEQQEEAHPKRAVANLSASELDRVLENFLSDQSVDHLINLTWLELEPKILHAESHRHMPLRGLFTNRLIFSKTDLSLFIKPSQGTMMGTRDNTVLYFDAMPREKVAEMKGTTSSVELFFPSTRHTIMNRPGHITSTRVTITNMGVYKRSKTVHCTKDYTTERDCLEELAARTKAEVCGCIGFTERHYQRFSRLDNGKWSRKPFCTPSDYKWCLSELRKAVELLKKDSSRCTPCTSFKNVYSASTTSSDDNLCPHSDKRYCYRAQVEFTCAESFSVVYDERTQLGLSQLISQIGGELGLYIGFSLVGVVEMVFLMCGVLKRRRATDERSGSAPEGVSWIDAISSCLGNRNRDGGDVTDPKMGLEKKVYRLEEIVRRMNWEVSKMGLELRRVKEMLQGDGRDSVMVLRSRSVCHQ